MSEPIIYQERLGTNCEKWDGLKRQFGEDGLLPLWVADMDFKAPACVQKALARMVEHGVYGYQFPPDSYYEAFIGWERERHGYRVERDWIRHLPGIVPGLFWMVSAFTRPGERCAMFSPSYYPFMNAIRETGRILVCSELLCNQGVYRIDFEDLERQFQAHEVKLFILASPHNPTGRVWTPEELSRLLKLCKQYGIYLISDEIHQDLVIGERPHTPTALMGSYDKLVTVTAASKTFNLAGLQNSVAVLPDKQVRGLLDGYIRQIHMQSGHPFGFAAVEAAYREGHAWLDGVLAIIRQNYELVRDTLAQKAPLTVVTPLEGTYLMWIDFAAYVPSDKLKSFIQGRCRLAVDYGDWFRPDKGDAHIRLNLATSRENIQEALDRILTGLAAG